MGPIERPSLLFNRSLMHMLSCDVHEYPPHTCQTAKWGLTLLSLCRVPKGHWDGVSQFLSMRLFAHRTPLTACERPRFMLGHDALCNSVSGASRLPLAPQFRTKASSRRSPLSPRVRSCQLLIRQPPQRLFSGHCDKQIGDWLVASWKHGPVGSTVGKQ